MKSFKENYIDDVNEMNEIFKKIKYGWELMDYNESYLPRSFYIDYKNIKLTLYARLPGNDLPQKYIFRMDGSKASANKASGRKAFAMLQRMSDKFVYDFSKKEYKGILWDKWNAEKGSPIWSVGYESPLLEFNPKYNNCELSGCVSYDVNSSYAYAMLSDMPDCSQGFEIRDPFDIDSKRVQEDEIGFFSDGDRLELRGVGSYATYIFKRVKSPFKSFVEKYYKQKKEAKTKEERQQYKDILNFAVGYILRKNPFIHACILGNARRFINRFKDKDTLYINTDCIVSRVIRPDLEALIGEDVGQFKKDHEGTFRRKNGAYQWVGEKPTARGVSKEWFENDFNLLTDEMPNHYSNKYELVIVGDVFKIIERGNKNEQ